MKKVLLIIAIAFVTCAKKDNTPVLKLRKIQSIKVNGVESKKDTIEVIETDYFKINLASIKNRTAFIGSVDGEKSYIDSNNFVFSLNNIVDEKDSTIKFANETEFLNYMSARKYEMVSQFPTKYNISYTFKKAKEE